MTPGTAGANWYPTACPTWCEGLHATVLMPDGADPDELPDAAELVTHSCTLTSPDEAEGLTVTLDLDEGHPASLHGITAGASRVHVWLPDDHESDGLTPQGLRAWAAVLSAAAEHAEQHLHGAGQ